MPLDNFGIFSTITLHREFGIPKRSTRTTSHFERAFAEISAVDPSFGRRISWSIFSWHFPINFFAQILVNAPSRIGKLFELTFTYRQGRNTSGFNLR